LNTTCKYNNLRYYPVITANSLITRGFPWLLTVDRLVKSRASLMFECLNGHNSIGHNWRCCYLHEFDELNHEITLFQELTIDVGFWFMVHVGSCWLLQARRRASRGWGSLQHERTDGLLYDWRKENNALFIALYGTSSRRQLPLTWNREGSLLAESCTEQFVIYTVNGLNILVTMGMA
jgi:hypothetical protein